MGIVLETCFLWILLNIEVLPVSSRYNPLPRSPLRGSLRSSVSSDFFVKAPLKPRDKLQAPGKFHSSMARKSFGKLHNYIILVVKNEATGSRKMVKQAMTDRILKDQGIKVAVNKRHDNGNTGLTYPKMKNEITQFENIGQPRHFKFSDLVY